MIKKLKWCKNLINLLELRFKTENVMKQNDDLIFATVLTLVSKIMFVTHMTKSKRFSYLCHFLFFSFRDVNTISFASLWCMCKILFENQDIPSLDDVYDTLTKPKAYFLHSIPLVNRWICKPTMFKHYTNYFWIEYVVFFNKHFNQKSHIPISNILPLSWRNLKNKILECIYRKRRERYKLNWTFQFKSYC